MQRRTLAALVAAVAGWGIVSNVAQAQPVWQLGTYGPPQVRPHSPSGPFRRPLDPSQTFGTMNTGMAGMYAGGGMQGGMQGAMGQPTDPNAANNGIQTGHPTTYFNYQKYFPLSYGNTGASNAVVGIIPITGAGGLGAGGFGMGGLGMGGYGAGAYGMGGYGVGGYGIGGYGVGGYGGTRMTNPDPLAIFERTR